MKKNLTLLALALAFAWTGRAAPPTTESIDKVLTLSGADQASARIIAQMNESVDGVIQRALNGQEPTAADQAIIDPLRQKITATMNEALGWPKLKVAYETAYAANFSQEEIDGLIAFYSSPAGKSLAAKGPLITEQTNGAIQQQMGPMMMELEPALRDAMQKLQAAHAPADEAPANAPASSVVTPENQHTKGPLPIRISYGQEVALKDYLVTGKTTVFDFYSDYCPPCRALSPHLEQLHKQRADVAVVKVDINRPGVKGIDWDSPVAHEFALQSIPHMKVYSPDGKLRAEGDDAESLVAGWIAALK